MDIGNRKHFVSLDFDGTIALDDVTDVIIQKFAEPGWVDLEQAWEKGAIGSHECLSLQMELIKAPLVQLVRYAGSCPIDPSIASFLGLLREQLVPFAILSDGFEVFIREILLNAGIYGVPVYANKLTEESGVLRASFPYAKDRCPAGSCKCALAKQLAGGLPLLHIGDGRSDFCLAGIAERVFSKGKLSEYCRAKGIAHTPVNSFADIIEILGGEPKLGLPKHAEEQGESPLWILPI